MTQIRGLCQVYHSFSYHLFIPRRASCTQALSNLCFSVTVFLHATWNIRNKHTKTHSNNWCWVITRDCRMVHQHFIRQISWIFISLFILSVWEIRQKTFHTDVSLAQKDTLTQAQKHRLSLTDISINTLILTHSNTHETLSFWQAEAHTGILSICSMRCTW